MAKAAPGEDLFLVWLVFVAAYATSVELIFILETTLSLTC
jgi:hypothetical protein